MAENNRESVSYRRNRDYKSHFVWTYELNRDLYRCYKTARENPSIGYMNRMKLNWDEIHPELDYFTSKQLRQQATFVERKDLVLANNHGTSNHGNDTTIAHDNVVVEESQSNNNNSDDVITPPGEETPPAITLLQTDTMECINDNSDMNNYEYSFEK